MPTARKPRKPKATKIAATSAAAASLTIVRRAGTIMDPVSSLTDAIRCRAYNYFEQRGRAHGHDFDDWIRAEAEFLAQYGAGPA